MSTPLPFDRNYVFTTVMNLIINSFSNAYVTSRYVFKPPTYPCVMIREIGRFTPRKSVTFNCSHDISESNFEIQIVSNLSDEQADQCYKIYSVADNAMKSLGYYLVSTNEVDDESKFSLISRYRRIIGSGETV